MLEGTHENYEELARLFRGDGSTAEAQRVAAHVHGCEECWRRATAAMADQEAAGKLVTTGPLRSLVDLYRLEQDRAAHWLEAQVEWTEIRSLGPKTRRERVRLTRTLHTVSFLEALLFEGNGPVQPSESEELFQLALIVARQLPEPRFSVTIKNDLAAECCAEIANACRRSAKWTIAREALKKGDEYSRQGSGNPVVEGKALCVAGALEFDLGNVELGAALLRRAARHFENTSNAALWGRTLVQLANALVDEDPPGSFRLVDQAIAVMPANSPRLNLLAERVRVEALLALGQPREALVRLRALQEMHEQFREPFIQLGRRFILARILENLNQFDRAESLFDEVIAGELEHGLVKQAFLDLAYLFGAYLRQERPEGAIAVCRRAIQELELLGDEEGSDKAAREQMRTVWRTLEQGVQRGRVEAGAAALMKRYITAHWRTPAIDLPTLYGQGAI